MNKQLVIIAVAFFACASFVCAQERAERRRGFYIDTGLGFGSIGYFNGDVKKRANEFNEAAKMGRITLDISLLTIGWALTQDMYLVGSIGGIGDGYFDSQMNQSQITVETYGIGTRYYPLPGKKYLQLGLDLGIGSISVAHRNATADSNFGFSGRLSAAYDFDSSMTGFTGLAGGALLLNAIENSASLGYTAFFKLAFK